MVENSPNGVRRAIRALGTGVTTLLLGGVLIAVLVWIVWGRTVGIDVHDGAACAQLYRTARTAADTARVDAQWPAPPTRPRGRSDARSVRCGALRAAGRVPG